MANEANLLQFDILQLIWSAAEVQLTPFNHNKVVAIIGSHFEQLEKPAKDLLADWFQDRVGVEVGFVPDVANGRYFLGPRDAFTPAQSPGNLGHVSAYKQSADTTSFNNMIDGVATDGQSVSHIVGRSPDTVNDHSAIESGSTDLGSPGHAHINQSASGVTIIATAGGAIAPVGGTNHDEMPQAGKSGKASKAGKARIPRPPNAFLLYRRDWHPHIKAANPGIHNNTISVILGQQWSGESPELRFKYKQMADEIKHRVMQANPDYRYSPRRSGDIRRRVTRRQLDDTVVPVVTPAQINLNGI